MSDQPKQRRSNDLPPILIAQVGDSPDGRDSVVATLEAVRAFCAPRIQPYRKRGDTWKVRARYLGLPAAALAAAAGVTRLADEGLRVLASVLALVGSALGAIVASLAPAQKSEEPYTQSKQMVAVYRNVSVLPYVDPRALGAGELRSALEDVLSQLDAIEQTSPAPSFLCRLKSKQRAKE